MGNTFPIRFADQMREHLRALRKTRGLTQAQLGALAGVSQARIAEIEAKPGLVNFDQMLQLLSLLGADLSLTLDGTPTDLPGANTGHAPASPPRKPATKAATAPRNKKSAAPSTRAASPARRESHETLSGITIGKKKGSW
jgi:HTH-type transcriptional regulator / antitoxin HipB